MLVLLLLLTLEAVLRVGVGLGVLGGGVGVGLGVLGGGVGRDVLIV